MNILFENVVLFLSLFSTNFMRKKALKTLKALLNLFTTAKKNIETTSELKNQDNNDGEN